MSRCFLIDTLTRNINLDEVKKFGEPCYIFRSGEDRPSVFDAENLSELLKSKFEALEFDVEKDFIVICGSLNMITNVVAFATNNYGICKALMFDFRKQLYISVDIG